MRSTDEEDLGCRGQPSADARIKQSFTEEHAVFCLTVFGRIQNTPLEKNDCTFCFSTNTLHTRPRSTLACFHSLSS